jgi:adenylate kinase family enzyme
MDLDALEMFQYTKVYEEYLKNIKSWQETLKKHIEKFADPYIAVDDISKQIVELTTDDIAQDYWLLILGYPGTGKSSLSIVFYKKIMEKLGYTNEEIRDWAYKDIIYLLQEYPKRIKYHDFLIKKHPEWTPNQIAHPIVLDEAHNIFDIFIDKSKDITELLQYVYEIREWRLIHIVNTQYPNQLAKRVQQRFKGIIYLWNEVIKRNHPLWDLYEWEYKKLFNKKPSNNKGYISWAAFYKDQKIPFLMNYLSRFYTIDQPGLILKVFEPDFIFPHFFILHESGDLYKIYRKIKDYGYTTKSLMKDVYEIKNSSRSIFMKIITELVKRYPLEFKDDKGTLEEPIEIPIPKKANLSGIENIGKVSIEKNKETIGYKLKIKKLDSTLIDYINMYYDVLVKRMPLYNIAEIFKREGFKK